MCVCVCVCVCLCVDSPFRYITAFQFGEIRETPSARSETLMILRQVDILPLIQY